MDTSAARWVPISRIGLQPPSGQEGLARRGRDPYRGHGRSPQHLHPVLASTRRTFAASISAGGAGDVERTVCAPLWPSPRREEPRGVRGAVSTRHPPSSATSPLPSATAHHPPRARPRRSPGGHASSGAGSKGRAGTSTSARSAAPPCDSSSQRLSGSMVPAEVQPRLSLRGRTDAVHDAKPHRMNGSSIRQAALEISGWERDLPRTNCISTSDRGLARLEARPTRGNLVTRWTAPIVSSGRSAVAGGVSSSSNRSGSPCNGPGGRAPGRPPPLRGRARGSAS